MTAKEKGTINALLKDAQGLERILLYLHQSTCKATHCEGTKLTEIMLQLSERMTFTLELLMEGGQEIR